MKSGTLDLLITSIIWVIFSKKSFSFLFNGENEIFGQMISNTGAEIGTNDVIISSQGPPGNGNYDATKPDVSWNEKDNEFLVVWSGDRVTDEDEIFIEFCCL